MAAFVTEFLNPCNYLGGVSFDPERDIQDLSGKVVLVTGGKSGSVISTSRRGRC
jgi:hypothetical protein